ncbi:unnamed protein product, partial [Nesidiocoris tenuis]
MDSGDLPRNSPQIHLDAVQIFGRMPFNERPFAGVAAQERGGQRHFAASDVSAVLLAYSSERQVAQSRKRRK